MFLFLFKIQIAECGEELIAEKTFFLQGTTNSERLKNDQTFRPNVCLARALFRERAFSIFL